MFINVWAVQHDAQIYPEPFKFKPERFLDENGHLLAHDSTIRRRSVDHIVSVCSALQPTCSLLLVSVCCIASPQPINRAAMCDYVPPLTSYKSCPSASLSVCVSNVSIIDVYWM